MAVHALRVAAACCVATWCWNFQSSATAAPPALPPVWGFNYDHFAPIVGGDGCMFTMGDLLALPASSDAAIAAHLAADFGAMRHMGGTAVRLYVPLVSLLANASAPNATALARLATVVEAAAAHGLAVDLTGANVMRPDRVPAWLADADDATLRTAQVTFWRGAAEQFAPHNRSTIHSGSNASRSAGGSGGGSGGGSDGGAATTAPANAGQAVRTEDPVLAFNLINEPTVPGSDGAPLSVGCLGPGPNGTSPFGPACNDTFCFCNSLWRWPAARLTAWAHARFADEAALAAHWPDYPLPGETWAELALPPPSGATGSAGAPRREDFAALQKSWRQSFCRDMVAEIRHADPTRRITLGDLSLSLGGPPTCTVEEDGLDYYSVHLYPSHGTNVSAVEEWWRRIMGNVPADGAPVVVEEMFPLGAPPALAANLTALLGAYLNATRPRATGWVSFYWGTAAAMRMDPATAALYSEWLAVWERGRPFARF